MARTVGISMRRKHQYYFFKVTILMWLIVLLSMPVFLYGFDELNDRMGLVSTMFLATAATLYVVGGDLPKTRKLNREWESWPFCVYSSPFSQSSI